ncbi:MAG: hypothetical protein ABSH53_07575 [Holophaga sp.]|jgi:hypothetical protein
MRVRARDLPPEATARLQRVLWSEAAGEGILLVRVKRVWLGWVGLVLTGAGVLSAWTLIRGTYAPGRAWDAALPWAGLVFLVYGAVALVEFLRVVCARTKPFLLLTPFNLVRCQGGWRPLEMFRLPEAGALERGEQVEGTTWQGRVFVFRFDGGAKVRFTLGHREQVAATERILELARMAGRGQRLPDCLGREVGELRPPYLRDLPRTPFLAAFLDPTSETWLALLAVLLIGMCGWGLFR